MDRRAFIQSAGTALGLAAACTRPPRPVSPPARARITDVATPISDRERQQRREQARRLMREERIEAMFLESGTSLYYYTGVRWGLSERPFGLVLPARGNPVWISPAFEEQRARELIGEAGEVRVWQEDESPYALVAQALRDRNAGTSRVGIEERVRFFIADGVRSELPAATFVSGTPVTAGCRMIKSPAEITLMQRANDVTRLAMQVAISELAEGLTPGDVSSRFEEATLQLGGREPGALVIFGPATAFPHGSREPRTLRAGDVVLIDAGCSVEGYQSDVTRTIVFGRPTARQREIWDLEKRAQTAAIEAAQVGATCESVDAAARRVITHGGFGPDYRVPGLPHRTGHGIGLDGHEWTNFVRGNTTRLAPGMCFSAEPTIAIYGEFGIRLEDCLYTTENGPVLFTQQSPSLEQPFA
jgi:Xaa-Pro aminopeptidase